MPEELISRNFGRRALPEVLIVRPRSRFWSSFFFQGSSDFLPTEKVEWDLVKRGAPLAHFVGEGLIVEPTERPSFTTDEIETPRYQYRKVLTIKELKNRLPGENDPFLSLTAEQRAGTLEAEDEIESVEALANLREVMCAQFMTSGIIPVVGVGVNRTIDYQLPNVEVLGTGKQWGDAGVDILESLEGYVNKLADMGYVADNAIISPEVAKVIQNDTNIRELLNNRRMEMGNIIPEASAEYGAAVYFGTFMRPYINLFIQRSIIPTDAPNRHLPAGMMILYSNEARQNKMAYGALNYMEQGLVRTISGEFIKQEFHDDRASSKEMIVTSRAIPLPLNVESWYSLKVC